MDAPLSAADSETGLTELHERATVARMLARQAGVRANDETDATERELWQRTAREYLEEAKRVEELIAAVNFEKDRPCQS